MDPLIGDFARMRPSIVWTNSDQLVRDPDYVKPIGLLLLLWLCADRMAVAIK